jgi:hypothetical protein
VVAAVAYIVEVALLCHLAVQAERVVAVAKALVLVETEIQAHLT